MSTQSWCRRRICLVAALLTALAVGGGGAAHAFDSELKELAQKIAGKLAHAHKKTLAVVDLVNLEGGTTLLGRFLAEEIANDLGNSETSFEIVDRTHTNTLIKEHKLSSNGFIDKLTATTLGNMTGAQALVLGTITQFGDSLRITVKVVDTKTANQIAAESTEFAKTKALETMYATPLPDSNTELKTAEKKQPAAPVKPASTDSGDEEEEPSNLIEVHGVRFDLAGCSRGVQTVTCRLTVQNRSRDILVYIGKATRMFSEAGGEFGVSEGTIANGGVLDGRRGDAFLAKKVVANVKTPVSLVFHDVNPRPKLISSLEIAFSLNEAQYAQQEEKISFRNVRLGAEGRRSVARTAAPGGGTATQEGQPAGGDGSLVGTVIDSARDGLSGVITRGLGSLFKKKPTDPPPPPPPPPSER